jgi:aryl-alcohol dehydrogenase (NADP+)
MQYTHLGASGLTVSRVCLGTMTFGSQCDLEQSLAIMDHAFDRGVTFIDTADVYPMANEDGRLSGTTEEIIGHWLASRGRRREIILASKCFAPMSKNRWDRGLSRKHILDAIDASLRRLGTDYLDLYQFHSWDARVPIDETLRAMEDVIRAGKVRYAGCSNWLAYQLARAIGRGEALGLQPLVSVQPRYNLLFREIERELLPLCAEEGIGVIPYAPIAGGFLSGKHRPGARTEGTRFTISANYGDRYWHDRQFETVEALRAVAEEAAMPLATLAMGWLLANPVVTAPIVGASRPEQLDDLVAAVDRPLGSELKAKLDAIAFEYRFGDAGR